MSKWVDVREAAIEAAKKVLGSAWKNCAADACKRIDKLIELAQYIEEHKSAMSKQEYVDAINQRKLAMENVLLTYKLIDKAAAQNATAAALDVILKALPGLIF